MKKILNNKLVLFGLSIVILLALVAIFAPLIAPYDPKAIDIDNYLISPAVKHLMGTDQLGRDVFSRLIYGTRISISIGFVAVGIAVVVGVFFGSVAGYFGGWLDNLIMRFVDIMLCFPAFFLILAIVALLEPGIYNIMIVIGITSWMGISRLIRAEILSLKQRE
ncbi:MAG: ABC transporter permease, partial [Candidatus Omnitrophota bacterium]